MTAATPPGVSASLVDALDHLLNQGAVVAGEATLSLGGVDLVYVGLNLLIASVETLRTAGVAPRPPLGPAPAPAHSLKPQPLPPDPLPQLSPHHAGTELGTGSDAETAAPLAPRLEETGPGMGHPPSDERPDQGLARLVLTLVELLRQLVERQALRRMEGGGLSDAQLERMGLALRDLAETMATLCDAFGLQPDELNLDLGPLGRLLDDGR